jgi:hypothetical protein
MPDTLIPDVFLDDKVDAAKLEGLFDNMVGTHALKLLQETAGNTHVDEEDLEGKAALKSLFSSMNWSNLADSYMLYAIPRIEEEGSWKDIKVSQIQLYDTFQDYLEEVFERDIQVNRGKSEVSNWRFLLGWTDRNGLKHRGLIDIFRSQGKPLSRVVEMFRLGTKWREGVSQMRQIEREFADDPDEAARRIIQFAEEQILNPNINLLDVRAAAPKYRGGPAIEPIAAETTGYYMTGADGAGMMVIPVENKSQAFAVQNSLKGVIANSDRSFFPRDALSGDLGREVKNMLTQGPMDVLRRRISDETIMDMIVVDDLKVILPITLQELDSKTLSELLAIKLRAVVGETYATDYLWLKDAVVGFLGAEIHIRMKADTDNSSIRI